MKPPRISLLVVGSVWLASVLAGAGLMISYAGQPGLEAASPATWPKTSGLPHHLDQPALLMFVHPRCSCSRASLDELAVLVAHCARPVDIQVIFLASPESGLVWTQTDLWEQAREIPGVSIHADEGGKEARIFHVSTSGATLLYDVQGRLVFQGGITPARGHQGDSQGRSTVEALLGGRLAAQHHTPVFGCSLFAKNAREAK